MKPTTILTGILAAAIILCAQAAFGADDEQASGNLPAATPPPQDGTDCDFPIIVDFGLFYEDLGRTSCYLEDNYSDTDLGMWDGGEDVIHELHFMYGGCINITVDPLGTSWTACGLFSDCPDVVGSLVEGATSSGSNPYVMSGISVEPGTYYLMIDTYPPPDCIPAYNLTITEAICPPPCGDVNDDGIVDIVDVSILIDYYFYDPTGSIVLLPNTANGDINGDGCVNIADIVMLVEYVTDPSKGAKLLCAPVAP